MRKKLYLCDDVKTFWPEDYGFLSRYISAHSWAQAEQIAEEKGLELVGEFCNFVDEATGKREFLH